MNRSSPPPECAERRAPTVLGAKAPPCGLNDLYPQQREWLLDTLSRNTEPTGKEATLPPFLAAVHRAVCSKWPSQRTKDEQRFADAVTRYVPCWRVWAEVHAVPLVLAGVALLLLLLWMFWAFARRPSPPESAV